MENYARKLDYGANDRSDVVHASERMSNSEDKEVTSTAY